MANERSSAARSGRIHFAMLTHGALAATQRCVRSLRATVPAPFTLFVVDNASTDGTREWLQQHGDWLQCQFNSDNRGVPGGRNDLLALALPQLADSDWLVFIDNDLEFHPGWLEPFVRAMASWPEARVLGKVGHFIVAHDDGRTLLPAPVQTAPVDVVSGGFACFVRKDAATAIGPFDEQLGRFWHEDDDYCVRALQHGFDVVAVPEAAITHHEHASGVANAGLQEGGSRDNQRYLAAKWRRHGWVDAGGFVCRRSGPWLPLPVREQLRGGRDLPIGRLELAQAMLLIEAMIDQTDPLAWFQQHRQPLPDCIGALLAMQLREARAMPAPELVTQLERIAATFATAGNTALLRPMLRLVGPPVADAPHGLCSLRDFADPEWLAVADELGIGALVRDPGSRDRGQWQQVSICRGLRRAGIGQGARVLLVDCELPLVTAWLQRQGAEPNALLPADDHGPLACDAVILQRLDVDAMRRTLSRCPAAALVVVTGEVALNGVPAPQLPQPQQLANDLLLRTELEPLAPIRTAVDDAVLEACVDRPERQHALPHLSQLLGPHLVTTFVVFARRVARPAAAVLLPAQPRTAAGPVIGVDLRTLQQTDSTSRGIGHYTVHHLAAVAARAPSLRFIGYSQQPEAPLPAALARFQTRHLDTYRPGDVALMHLPDPMNLEFGFDSPLRVLRHPRTTLTFHDLTPLHHYIEHWPRRNREAYLDRLRQLESSDALLLTNSAFTASDLQRHTGVDAARITPILAGCNGTDRRQAPSPQRLGTTLRGLGITGPFVLHVGAHDPHKNFLSALTAFLIARSRRPLQLVVVGAVDPGISRAAALCAAKKIPDVLFTGYLPRGHLDCLYTAATALLFLSRAEGFGFPLLEAMAAGCPVIGSNATSHPEVVGDAGVLVDADDSRAAAAALDRLLAEPALVAKLRERGYRQAAQFSWDAVAERTLAVWSQAGWLDGWLDGAAGSGRGRQVVDRQQAVTAPTAG